MSKIELRILEKKVNAYENSGMHKPPERYLQYRDTAFQIIDGQRVYDTWKDVPVVKEEEFKHCANCINRPSCEAHGCLK